MVGATRSITTVLATLLAVFLSSAVAAACSCVEMTTSEQVSNADIVVRGVFEHIELPDEAGRNAGRPAVYTLRPTHLWKGDVVGTFTIETAPDGAACGLEGFQEGSDVMLFATDHGDGLTADLCGGTAVADEGLVAEVSEILGEGEPMTVAPSPPDPQDSSKDPDPGPEDVAGDWVGPAITAVGAVLLVGASVALWRLWLRKGS